MQHMQIEKWFNTETIKRFYFPGKIFIGRGVFEHAVTICKDIEGTVVIVLDKAFAEKQFVITALETLKSKISGMQVIAGAPIAQDVLEFVQTLNARPAAILAIGGGSVTDFSKAIAAHFMYGSIDAVGLKGQAPNVLAPKPLLVSIPTTAGSGAEASRYYVTYDRHDHHKIFGKSWDLVADWIMLDPIFLEQMPEDILVACAFDAFVHLFETLICQHERSLLGAIYHGERNDKVHERLMQSATIGGVAISNVRTGNMHEAAGALLELTNLSHPETLYVFFRDVVEQYKHAITEREQLLIAHLRLIPHFENFKTIDDVIKWWEAIFHKVGLDKKVRDRVKTCTYPTEQVREHVFKRVFADKVWINKESPVVLDEMAIKQVIDRSFQRFGFANT
jgi:alcohol dehydrogenase class IV